MQDKSAGTRAAQGVLPPARQRYFHNIVDQEIKAIKPVQGYFPPQYPVDGGIPGSGGSYKIQPCFVFAVKHYRVEFPYLQVPFGVIK